MRNYSAMRIEGVEYKCTHILNYIIVKSSEVGAHPIRPYTDEIVVVPDGLWNVLNDISIKDDNGVLHVELVDQPPTDELKGLQDMLLEGIDFKDVLKIAMENAKERKKQRLQSELDELNV